MEVVVGRIGRPHGLRGEVTVQVTTDDPDDRFASGAVLGTDPASRGPLTVVSMRRSGPVLVLGFDGVADRNAAEALRGTSLTLDASLLPVPDDPEEFYDHQLVGLSVVDRAGTVLGTVTEVWHRLPHPCSRWIGRTAPRSWCHSSPRSCRSSTSKAAGWSSTHRTGCSPTPVADPSSRPEE